MEIRARKILLLDEEHGGHFKSIEVIPIICDRVPCR